MSIHHNTAYKLYKREVLILTFHASGPFENGDPKGRGGGEEVEVVEEKEGGGGVVQLARED